MARDDDEDDRPRKKSPRDEDEDDDDERPRKKPPRDEDESPGKTPRPMPTRLVGAIIASMAWGILLLYGSCMLSCNGILQVVQIQKAQAQMREAQQRMREQMRDVKGFQPVFDFGGGESFGQFYTALGAQVFMFLMAALLLAGGAALLMRKGFGKYLAMGAPVGMLLVEFTGFVVCLIITKGTFLAPYNVEFLVNILFSLIVGGCIAFLLLNKDVSKALK